MTAEPMPQHHLNWLIVHANLQAGQYPRVKEVEDLETQRVLARGAQGDVDPGFPLGAAPTEPRAVILFAIMPAPAVNRLVE